MLYCPIVSASVATLSSGPGTTVRSGSSTDDTTIVHRLFEGTLTSETRCLTCETVSGHLCSQRSELRLASNLLGIFVTGPSTPPLHSKHTVVSSARPWFVGVYLAGLRVLSSRPLPSIHICNPWVSSVYTHLVLAPVTLPFIDCEEHVDDAGPSFPYAWHARPVHQR